MPEIVNRMEIGAEPERVYRVARDVERFPEFMPDVESIHVAEASEDGRRTVVDWVGLIPELRQKAKWTEADLWDDAAHCCDFSLVRRDFKSDSGTSRFLPRGGGMLCESVVRYEIQIPLVCQHIQGV